MGRGVKAMGSSVELAEVGAVSGHKPDTAHGCAVKHHDGGLLAIGLLKLVEAVFAILVGVGAIHFLHHDLADAAQRLAVRLRFDLDGRIVTYVMDHLDTITALRLKQIGAATLCYAVLRVTEGVGLVMEKIWAEYLTVGVTVSFLPWEMYEIVKRADWFRVSVLVGNLLVLAYLVWWMGRQRARRASMAE